MAPQSHQKLLRVQSARSSLGCMTCKSRRVKCDESRPQCQRCLKAHVTCHYQTAEPLQPANKIIIYVVPRPLQENPDLVQSEKRSLHYFRCRAALQMVAPFHSRLWTEHIFQLAQEYGFILSAVVALSSMHESFSQEPNSRERYRDDAIHHYNKAMREIFQARQSEPSVTAVLVASIVFYSLECLRGSFYRALQHIQSGVKIISQRRQRSPQDSHQQSLLSESLNRDFLALQNHIMELGHPSISRAYDAIRSFDPPIPARFESVDDALYYLQIVYNECHCLFDYYGNLTQAGNISSEILSNDIGTRYEKVCQKLSQWSLAFTSLDGSLTRPRDVTERQAFSILRIYYSVLKVMLDNVFSGDCFNRYDADVARILEEAEIFLNSQDKDMQAFSLSFGVIAPLFMLAWRCNYAPARDKSLGLLSANRRREGIWDSQTVVKLAQRVIAFKSRMEAMGCGGFVNIFHISFVSETACQMDIVVNESSAPLDVGLGFENWPKERKHVEIVDFDPIQLFD